MSTYAGILSGEIAPQELLVGYVLLSLAVSFIGSVTTVELLNRRTAGRGYYNWSLLIGSSISMGSVAIWSMHYIGMRAIVLDHGYPPHQLSYNPGFTALSFFLPILILLVAYWFIGANEKVSKARVSLGGIIAGLAVCAMHYVGQLGINNYTSVYKVAHVVGSIIIAVVASTFALVIFFILRSKWTGTWYKRLGCGMILGGAVSSMHWVAATGTRYRLKSDKDAAGGTLTRKTTVVIVLVFAILSCACLVAYAVLSRTRGLKVAYRAEKIALSAIVFDSDGNIMVTPEGSFPSEIITDSFPDQGFADEFTYTHQAFQWIYRASQNWLAVKDLISGMRRHLRQLDVRKSTDELLDYSVIFKEMFCVAAQDLSQKLNHPLEDLGVLYSDIVQTGKGLKMHRNRYGKTAFSIHSDDVEKPPLIEETVIGKGQTLFVFRKADKAAVARLQASGFRFTDMKFISENVARGMQLPKEELVYHLESMQRNVGVEVALEPGVHLGAFAVRANVGGDFSIVVQNEKRNLIPSVPVHGLLTLTEPMVKFLEEFDGMILDTLEARFRAKLSYNNYDEQLICQYMLNAITGLKAFFHMETVNIARLYAKPIEVFCRPSSLHDTRNVATMIVFRIVLPIHWQHLTSDIALERYRFFNTQQRCFSSSPDHDVFARQAHSTFAGIADAPLPSYTMQNNYPLPTKPKNAFQKMSFIGRSSSSSSPTSTTNPFASIMVSQSVTVDTHVKRSESEVELNPMAHTGAAIAVREVEEPTWADDVFQDLMDSRVEVSP